MEDRRLLFREEAGYSGNVAGGGQRPGCASLAKRLRDHGCTVLTTFEALLPGETESAAFAQLIRENGESQFDGVAVVIDDDILTDASPLARLERPVRLLLEIAKIASGLLEPGPFGFWLLTKSAQAFVESELPSPF